MSDKNYSSLPSAIAKRDLLFGTKTADSAHWKSLGLRFLEADWLSDAVDFLTRAGDHDTLRKIRDRVVEEGDAFLFLKIQRSIGQADVTEAADRALLQKCATQAEQAGKHRYAMKAFEKLGDTDNMERIRALLANDGDIRAEAETQVFIPASEEESDGEGA